MATQQQTRNAITLKGSAAIVSEFFGYSISSVLYQRGIYPESDFTRIQKYNQSLFVTKDPKLSDYLAKVLEQLQDWLSSGRVKKLVLAICSATDPNTTLERWVFDIETREEGAVPAEQVPSMQALNGQISSIMRQIAASVTFLPLLDEPCTFDLLVYTDTATQVPALWEESDPRRIEHTKTHNSAEVRLRTLDTSIHRIDTLVSYRVEVM